MEDKETLCIYCDKTCDVIIWNGLYNEEEESIYLCERCHRHLQRKDALSLKALRIVSQRACANLASDEQSFFYRMDLSALSVVLDEDNGKEVEKAEPERQVVVATYYTPQSVFKVPKGKDINKAHSYWVKYNTLHIFWTKEDEDNDNLEEIEPYWDVQEIDCKYPQDTEVELAEDHNIESSEDDEE